jgi:nucleoside-diphosphate-sugar epimerase
VNGTLLFATLPKEKVCGKSFNLAREEKITIEDVVKKINKILGTNSVPFYMPERKGDIKHSCADISKAWKLGYRPTIDFNTGLKLTIKYYKKSYNGKRGE